MHLDIFIPTGQVINMVQDKVTGSDPDWIF